MFSHSSGSFPSASSLQTPAVCEKFSFTEFFKFHRSLRQGGILNRESQERPGLVGKSPSISLFSTNKLSTPKQDNNFRCFRLWLGDLVQWGTVSGSLVRRRDKVAYKSERVDGRFYWPKAICQMSALPYSHSSSNGQHNSSSLCEQNRGHYFFRSMYASPSYVGLGRGKEHSSVSCTSSRSAKLNSRHSFSSDRSRFRVDVKPFNFSTSLFNLQYSKSRPVCYPSEQSSSKFCVLVPRSRSNGDKCIHSSLVRSFELCLSPIQSDYEVSEKDPNRQSQSPFCGSSVEIETMVPGPSFNDVRSPTIASECFGSVDTTILPREAPAETSDSGRVAAVRRCLSKFSLPSRVSEIVMSSWRSSTKAQYGSAWAKWSSWCVQRQEDPTSCNLHRFLGFLAELFDAGLQYRTINVYRSAISVSHLPVDGCLLGSHPLVTHFMKGVDELRPPQPRVFNTWSVNTVLIFLRSLHPSEDLPLKTLTFKFVMLSALVSAARSSYLHQFDLKFHYMKDNCYYFIIPGLVKGSRHNKPHLEACLPSFSKDSRLCIFTYCKEYIKRTQALRPRSSSKDPLFLSYIKPHRPVKTCSIARWVKRVLSLSGTDTSHFTAHSFSCNFISI